MRSGLWTASESFAAWAAMGQRMELDSGVHRSAACHPTAQDVGRATESVSFKRGGGANRNDSGHNLSPLHMLEALLPDLNDKTPLYPLKFRPRLVPRMWGGRRLAALGKALPPGNAIGESWELYDFPPGVVEGSTSWLSSEVVNGPLSGRTLHALLLAMPQRLLGNVPPLLTPAGPQFPILIKFLDAMQDLSIQVHPDEAYAAAHPGAQVKNEAWNVIEHEPGARLLKGLRPGTTREVFERSISDGSVERLVQKV